MLEWFYEMFAYARESRAATNFVERLLSARGPLTQLSDFSKPGNPQLFFALAQADSKTALRWLTHVLEQASEAERRAFETGRREVIHGLELLAIPAASFEAAAECLLLLAEAENETWSNNATGVFVSLFSLGYGKLAASELPPTAKVPYLRRLLRSDRRTRRELAIKSIEESLHHFISRIDVGSTAGLRLLPERWMPKTFDELWKGYSEHIELLAAAFNDLPDCERLLAAKAIIGNARSLVQIEPISTRVIDLLRDFSRDQSLKETVVEALVSILHFDRTALPLTTVKSLEELRQNLTESSYHDRLRRYAGLKLLEDNFTEDGTYTDEPHPTLRALASEALMMPHVLEGELSWLVTEDAKNGFQFGALLGKDDANLALWTMLKNAWLNAGAERTDYFLGGYLSGLFNRDPVRWEITIRELFVVVDATDEILGLVWRSGMSDAVARELLARCEAGRLEPRRFRLLVYGGVVRSLPLDVLISIVTKLSSGTDTQDVDAALELLQSRLRMNSEDVSELLALLAVVLSHPFFVRGSEEANKFDNMRDYRWTEGAKTLAKHSPERGLALAVLCLQTFGSEGSITDRILSQTPDFLDSALEQWPVELWHVISQQLRPKFDRRTFRLLQWLRGRRNLGRSEAPSGLELIPPQIVLDWVAGDPASRAWLIAEHSPPVLSRPSEPKTLARLVLEHYGDQVEVRRALHANFMSGGFWGPASAHFQSKLDTTRVRLLEEPNALVRLWLQEEADRLTEAVQAEREREEADD